VFPDCMGDGTAPMKPGAGLAQLVEHLICNQGVTSSNLVAGTIVLIDFSYLFDGVIADK
jgi:hypothetical protein